MLGYVSIYEAHVYTSVIYEIKINSLGSSLCDHMQGRINKL